MKTLMKRLLTATLILVTTAAMSISVFAAAITGQEEKTRALTDAGVTASEVSNLKVRKDGDEFEIKFTKKSDKSRYEYEIAEKSGKIKEITVKYAHKKVYSSKKISKAKAYKKVAAFSGNKLKTVKSGTCKYKKEDGEWIYEIKFKEGACEYEFEILAANGKIIESEKEFD